MSSVSADFRPPAPYSPVVRLAGLTVPWILRWARHVVDIEIPDKDIERIRALRDRRLLIAPNHPTNDDPALLFALSRASGLPFYYLACRETFDAACGFYGRFLQRIGAYSVVRGTADRESFRMTRRLLATPGGRVVIFPEGEVYSQNDTLLPFQSGVVQLAFWAMEDVRSGGEPDGSVSILPVAVRYVFVADMTDRINAALSRLERAVLGTSQSTSTVDSHYERLRALGVAVLTAMETEYGLKSARNEESDLTARMDAMKSLLLERAAGLIGVTLPAGATLPERMRFLINRVHDVVKDPPGDDKTPYGERLHAQQAERAAPLMRDLERVANWIAVRDNYVRARPTPERMADNIRRLEVEVFGAPALTGPRRAIVRVGEPIDLARFAADYKADRRGAVAKCVDLLEEAVQALLDGDTK